LNETTARELGGEPAKKMAGKPAKKMAGKPSTNMAGKAAGRQTITNLMFRPSQGQG